MNSSKKIFVNTIILYGRMILSVGINLYTTRLVLNALGVVDYGIYNLVAGVVFMLSFLNSAMTTSTQRFLSYYQGKNDLILQKKIFSNSLKLHIFIGLVVILVLEIASFFIFRDFLKIPTNRLSAARFVYHLMSLTVFFTITVVPFNALLISHENMFFVALGNLIQNILQLIAAYLLTHIITGDKLKFYGLSTELISFLIFCILWCICYLKYKECHGFYKMKSDKKLMKEIASNVSWNLLGVLSGMAKNQGLAVVFNVYNGPVINTAYALASQVSGQLNFVSAAMLRSINPQIMKSEGEGNRERMLRLSFFACKIGFFLLAIVSIPVIIYMPEILTIWLKKAPLYSVNFCRWVVIAFMANQLTMGLDSAIQAKGSIRKYMIIVASCKIALIPIAIVLLYYKLNVTIVLAFYCITEFVGSFLRIYVSSITFFLKCSFLLKNTIYPCLLTIAITALIIYIWNHFFQKNYFMLNILFYMVFFGVSFFTIGLNKEEKKYFVSKIHYFINNKIFYAKRA